MCLYETAKEQRYQKWIYPCDFNRQTEGDSFPVVIRLSLQNIYIARERTHSFSPQRTAATAACEQDEMRKTLPSSTPVTDPTYA